MLQKLSHRLWGTSPEDVLTINSKIPDPTEFKIMKKENQLLDL